MGKRSSGRGREYWEPLVQQLLDSGEDLPSFARKRGLKAASLRWWRWHLGRLPRFVELVAPAASTLEVIVGGRTVRVESGFDEKTFVRVIQLLEGFE